MKKTSPKPTVLETLEPIFSENLLGRAGFLLNKAALKIRELYEESLKSFGLIGKDLGVLMVLEEKGFLTQQEIGKCMHIDRTTMVDVIDGLEKSGFVERKVHPTDRRSYSVYLTAKGKEILPRAKQLGNAAEKKFLSHLSLKEQKVLNLLLRHLVLAHYSPPKK